MSKFLKWFFIGLAIIVATVGVLLVLSLALPEGWKMTPEILVVLAASVLSFSLTKVSIWRTEFAALPSETKSYINIGLVVLLAVFMFLGTCTGWFVIPGVICTVAGIKTLALYVFLAIGGNQLTYTATPQPADVKAAKADRSD